MSAAARGGGGMDGDNDKKRKRAIPEDAPDLFIDNSDDSDDESAPTDKKQKLEPSFRLTKFGNKRTRVIAKKHGIEHRKFLKALKELAGAERVVAAARTTLAVLSEKEAKNSFLAKKCRIKRCKVQKALKELAEVERAEAAARDRLAVLFDQPTGEGNQEEEVDQPMAETGLTIQDWWKKSDFVVVLNFMIIFLVTLLLLL